MKCSSLFTTQILQLGTRSVCKTKSEIVAQKKDNENKTTVILAHRF